MLEKGSGLKGTIRPMSWHNIVFLERTMREEKRTPRGFPL